MHYKFSIDYYENEEHGRPELKVTDFKTIDEAGKWAQKNYIPLSVLIITEWSEKVDAAGIPEIVGSCNLEVAYKEKFTSLDSYHE